jgi:hypothetical protein
MGQGRYRALLTKRTKFDSKYNAGGKMRRKNRTPVRRNHLRLVDQTYRTPPRKYVRVRLDFSEEAKRRLDEIRALGGQETNAQLIEDALRVYEWLLNARRAGKYLEVVTPIKVFGIQIFERTERIFKDGS